MRLSLALLFALPLLAACQQDPDVISSTPSEITLKTHGDMATAEARARAYCGRNQPGAPTKLRRQVRMHFSPRKSDLFTE